VYAYNDFSHIGNNPGVRLKKTVTPNMNKPLLVSEHSGHMFPTKSYDTWTRRQEHALRHATVQNAAAASGEHCGCFGWCMFDYPTHKDFGSGDRVCYHGVLDFHRNPKLAADVYAAQQEKKPILSLSSNMDIGDYNGGQLSTMYAFSNAQKVLLYKNDIFVTELKKGKWNSLPHGPFVMDDIVGDLLQTQEGYDKKKADDVRKVLLTIADKGLEYLSAADKLNMARVAMKHKINFQTAWDLYGKYIGNWGGEATVWRVDAITDGKVVASKVYCPNTALRLEVTPSATELQEKDSYDVAAVRIRVVDANGNTASYAQIPVKLALEGSAELIGPDILAAEGGMCGTYIRTTGKQGEATLTISSPQTEAVTITFTMK
jgi:beta-galactosidase